MSANENNIFLDRNWKSISAERASAYVTSFDMAEDGIIRFLQKKQAKDVCDAGCGCGVYSLKLLHYGFSVCGFDIAENAVSLTKVLLSENGFHSEGFKQADVLSTGYADGCFDAVVARDVIDHMSIKQGIAAINELLRIVRPDGCVLLTLDLMDNEYESEPYETNDDGDYLYVQGKWVGMVFHPYSPNDIEILADGKRHKIMSSDDHGFIVVLEANEQTTPCFEEVCR